MITALSCARDSVSLTSCPLSASPSLRAVWWADGFNGAVGVGVFVVGAFVSANSYDMFINILPTVLYIVNVHGAVDYFKDYTVAFFA